MAGMNPLLSMLMGNMGNMNNNNMANNAPTNRGRSHKHSRRH